MTPKNHTTGLSSLDKAKLDEPAKEGLDLSGRTLADFRILRLLGQGGMGQVYLAEQISLKRQVALKILRPELASSPEALQRFEREATSAARANHPNIVQVHAFGVADGLAYIAMEYVEGRNLRQYLARKGPPELLVALSIMRQVALALQRAAELGIVHRDIKPENILLTRKVEVKVADFGLARGATGSQEAGAALNLTQSGVTIGTPLYMSPEQVEGKPLDPRSDIYSLGVTCYHMLAGHPPFQGDTAFEVALQHVRGRARSLAEVRPDLPEALCAIVHKMMAKNPDERYQTARDLLRDVLKLRETLGAPSTASQVHLSAEQIALAVPTTPLPKAPAAHPSRLRKWLVAALMLLAFPLAASGGALYAWAKRANTTPFPGGVPGSFVDASSDGNATLKATVEQYLSDSGDKRAKPEGGFDACADLGLVYLEAHQLDDARKLYTRLSEFTSYKPYVHLGELGLAIVLALEDNPLESNRHFREVFPDNSGTIRPAGKTKAEPKYPSARIASLFATNAKWRYYCSRALWFNLKNQQPLYPVPAALRPYGPGIGPANTHRLKKDT
jgi:serine/threonine-protein kinase